MSQPSGPIQVIPPGFLGLLNLKNLGRLPDTLQGTVQPTVDLEAWWLRATAQDQPQAAQTAVTTGASVVSFATPVVVPDDETWWVESVMLDTFIPAAAGNLVENVAPIIIYNRNAPLQYGFLAPAVSAAGSAAATTHNLQGARGFWMPPSSELAVYYGRVNVVTNVTFTQYLRAARLSM